MLRSAASLLRPSHQGLAWLQALVADGWSGGKDLISGVQRPQSFSTERTSERAATQLQKHDRTTGTSETASQQRIYAAVVLERLPVVRSPPPEWEAEYKAWAEQQRLQRGFYKQYPETAKKVLRQKDDDAGAFNPVPVETAADGIGDVSTMKRKLREKLVLLVKQRDSAIPADSESSSGGGSGGAKGSKGAGAGGAWAFPHVQHKEGETIRATAERALQECAGVAEVFFIGNAPMAHHELGGSSGGSASAAAGGSGGGGGDGGGLMFFMLAQAVNDPWDISLESAFASGHAWVTVEELPRYLRDDRLVELAGKML